MNPFQIHIEGDPILKQKCVEATSMDNVKELVDRMFHTLRSIEIGVGLAAPQIGIAKRIFIMGSESHRIPEVAFINPTIIKMKGAQRKATESCLSVPQAHGRVSRYQKVKIKYYDINFKEQIGTFREFEARIIQHEYDHLDGIEFYDRVEKHEFTNKLKRQIEALRKGEFPFMNYLFKMHSSHYQTGEL